MAEKTFHLASFEMFKTHPKDGFLFFWFENETPKQNIFSSIILLLS